MSPTPSPRPSRIISSSFLKVIFMLPPIAHALSLWAALAATQQSTANLHASFAHTPPAASLRR
ncbi:hypothetical protein HDE77_001929 [Rhodanobacter sp. MP7CTX1]|nr:hypothetical protein [Rhodanobacter sp. MP7CTX1]